VGEVWSEVGVKKRINRLGQRENSAERADRRQGKAREHTHNSKHKDWEFGGHGDE
jgi:cytidylate kinase